MNLLLRNKTSGINWAGSPLRIGMRHAILSSWIFCALFASTNSAVGETSGTVDLELRVVWGGSQPIKIRGNISIKGGSLELVRNLSIQKDSVGSLCQSNKQEILVSPLTESTFAGMDIHVRGHQTSRLGLQIWLGDSEEPVEYEIDLQELQSGTWVRTLGDNGVRIAVERQPHDRLRVNTSSEKRIVDCSSLLKLEISGYRTGLPEGEYTLAANWSETRSGQPVASSTVQIDSSGSFNPMTIEVKTPDKRGAYRLELNLIRPNLLTYLTNTKPLLSRSIEFLVHPPDYVPDTITGWRPVLAVDPVTGIRSGGLGWLTSGAPVTWPVRAIELRELSALSELSFSEQWNRLMSFSRSVPSVGSVERSGKVTARDFTTVDQDGQPQSQQCVEMESGNWLTIPLSGLQPGHPHRLRIEVPVDRSGLLSITIRDQSDKEARTLPVQSNLLIRELDVSSQGGSLTHDVVFWPASDSISVVLASVRENRTVSVGKILLERAELSSASNFSDIDRQNSAQQRRGVGLYIDQPLVVDSLAAPRERDMKNERDFETWATWQAVAERLLQSVQLSGGNCLVLTAMTDGAALFPIQSVSTVPWLNKSTFFADGRSPDGHDVIELLLRHFDRAGIQLILELDLKSSQLQLLEFCELGPNGVNEEFVQADFESNTASMSTNKREQGAFRPANPLHPKVQEKLITTIVEVASKYSHHPSFSGICLRLHQDSPFNFAGHRSGFNSSLIDQFAHHHALELPSSTEERDRLFQSAAKPSFLNWRAQQLTQFFGALSHAVREVAPDTALYLNTTRLWNQKEGERSEAESAMRNPEQFLLGFGLDISALAEIDGLIITQGSVRRGWIPLASKDWNWQSATEHGVRPRGSVLEGSLISHQPQAKVYASNGNSDAVSSNSLKIYADAVVHGKHARQILIEQIYRADLQLLAFGGWYPIWTQESSVAELLATLQALPPIPLSDTAANLSETPIRVRVGNHQGKTYCSVVNNSDSGGTVRLRLNRASELELQLLGGRNPEDLVQEGDNVSLRLRPFDMLVWSSQSESIKVIAAQFEPSENSLKLIAERLERMENLLTLAGEPGAQRILFQVGGTFENWVDSTRPLGWSVSTLPSTRIEKATELPRSGSSCISIENENRGQVAAWIQSVPIDLPTSGRLSVRAWLRSSAADNRQPVVRLGLIGRFRNGRRYEESIYYGGVDNAARPLSNDWGRRPAELNISDVPVQDLVELKVAIDLIGPGRVWVDDVEVVEIWLHPDERNYLRGQLLVAKQKLAANNSAPAERLLRSQWNEYLRSRQPPPNLDRTANNQPIRRSEEPDGQWNRQKSTIQQWREGMLERWRR